MMTKDLVRQGSTYRSVQQRLRETMMFAGSEEVAADEVNLYINASFGRIDISAGVGFD